MSILAAWLLADFISGLVHWWEDRLLLEPSKFNLIESVRQDNDLHHARPFEMLKNTPLDNSLISLCVAWPIALLLYLGGASILFWMAFFFLGFAALTHRWAHMHSAGLPWPLRFMQWTGLFQSFDAHKLHHYRENMLGPGAVISKNDTSGNYCAMSDWLNPVLDKMKFFGLLERIFKGKRQ